MCTLTCLAAGDFIHTFNCILPLSKHADLLVNTYSRTEVSSNGSSERKVISSDFIFLWC